MTYSFGSYPSHKNQSWSNLSSSFGLSIQVVYFWSEEVCWQSWLKHLSSWVYLTLKKRKTDEKCLFKCIKSIYLANVKWTFPQLKCNVFLHYNQLLTSQIKEKHKRFSKMGSFPKIADIRTLKECIVKNMMVDK